MDRARDYVIAVRTVHHDELAGRVLDLMALHPAWHLPLGYKNGEFGAERVPSGAYLGDRDMFLFLVDGNRDLDDPTDRTHAGLFRGFILPISREQFHGSLEARETALARCHRAWPPVS